MQDLTILFLTANRLPDKWVAFHKQKLLEAAKDYPIITISQKPMDFGLNLLQDKPYSISNVYYQMLRGAKLATTPWVAIAEDDCLYPPVHFRQIRPDTFAYNINRFNLFTWGPPTYSWKDRFANSTFIAPRELLIEALEERFAKYPDGTPEKHTGELGRHIIEKALGLTPYKAIEFTTAESVIKIDHEHGLDHSAARHTKVRGILRAYEIPYWGRAEDIVAKFV